MTTIQERSIRTWNGINTLIERDMQLALRPTRLMTPRLKHCSALARGAQLEYAFEGGRSSQYASCSGPPASA